MINQEQRIKKFLTEKLGAHTFGHLALLDQRTGTEEFYSYQLFDDLVEIIMKRMYEGKLNDLSIGKVSMKVGKRTRLTDLLEVRRHKGGNQ